MRKRFYAGAVLGGLLLLGTTPAYADDLPVPVGGLTGLLSTPEPDRPGLDLGHPLVDVQLSKPATPAESPSPSETATARQAPAAQVQQAEPDEPAPVTGGLPLLGGLGGLLPVDEAPDRASGMPAGGTPVADDDPRLHDEPAADERAFSDSGRPIAGEDVDFP